MHRGCSIPPLITPGPGGVFSCAGGYTSGMVPDPIGDLLGELRVRWGFCLAPYDLARLTNDPPSDADAFTDAVFVAEGLGDAPGWRFHPLWKEIRNHVASRFAILRPDPPPAR